MKPLHRLSWIALLLVQFSVFGASTSWKGTISKDWRTAGNWTAGVPTAGLDAIIGDANFTGANQPDLSKSSVCKSLTIGTGAKVSTLKVDQTFTVSGNVVIGTNGTITHSRGTMSLAGNWTKLGTYTASGAKTTVAFSGATQSLAGFTTFRILAINASSTTVLNTNVVVAVQLTVSGTLDPNEAPTRTVTGAGKLVVNSGGRLQVKAATFVGNYALTGAKTFNVASTVDYAATAVNQTINNTFVYGSLRVSGALTKALAGNLPALASSQVTSGNLVVDGGILDVASFSANRGTTTVGGTLSVANGASLRIGGTNTIPANYHTHILGPSSTVEFYGAVQTVPLESYGNLTLSTSSGAVTKTMPAAAMTLAGNLTSTAGAGSSLSYTAGGALTVNGNVFIGAGTTFNAGAFTHTIGGNWTNDGVFAGGSGSVTLQGNGAVIAGAGSNQFSNLNLTGTGVTAASTTSLSVSGNFTTAGAGTFAQLAGGSGTVTLSGASKSISGTGIDFNNLTVSGSISTTTSFSIAGNLLVSGSLTANGGSITLSGSGKTISGAGSLIFNSLNVPGAISTTSNFTLKSDLIVPGTFGASAGTATFAGTSTLSGAANLFNVTLNGTKLQLGPSSVLGIAGSLAIISGTFDTTSTTPNTVSYNGAIPQTVVPLSYYNLSFAGSGTKSAGGTLTVFGDVSIGGGTAFNASPSTPLTHSIHGNWINSGTFSPGTGTIELLGGQDTIVSGANTFNTLTLNKNSAAAIVTLDDDASVSLLNMTRGDLHTGTNTVTITSNRAGNGIILGTITRTHPFLTGTAYAFEGPFNTINFTSGSAVSSVTVSVVLGPVRDFPFGGSINRQYAIGLTSGTPYTATLRLHYLDLGLNGNSESGMGFWHFGGPWAASGKTANDATDNWVEQSSLTNIIGRWTLSDDVNAVRWNGAVDDTWENAGNWIAAQGSPHLPPSTNDIVELASVPFSNQPRISTSVSIRTLSFGSVQPITVTLDTGATLVLAGNSGNITGIWTNDATHTIDVGAQVLSIGGVFLLSDGTNGHAINLNIGTGTVHVADEFGQSGGAALTFTDAGELEIGGDFSYVDGPFAAGAGTVRYNGSTAQIVAGGISYNNLAFDKSAGIATLSLPATATGDLTVGSNSVLLAEADLGVAGNVAVGSSAALQIGAATMTVGGDWVRSGTFTPGTGTVIFDGTGPQSIAASTFNNLSINKAGGAATPTGNLLLNGNLDVFGVLDLGLVTANRSVLGGMFSLGSGATLTLGTSFPLNFGAHVLAPDSLVEYLGSGPQSVSAENYGHLHLSNGGASAKTLSGSTSVAGDLLVNAGATLAASAFVLDVQGNWLNNGTFFPGASSVTLGGISKNVQGLTTFNNLAVGGAYSLLNGIVVNGTLNLSGTLSCGSTTNTFGGDFFNTGTFTSSGAITFPGTGSHAILLNGGFTSSGTVNFNGTAAIVVAGSASPAFQQININNTGGVSSATDWMVNGDFFVGSGAVFTAGSSTITVKGAFNNQGTVSSSGTLLFDPANPVTLTLRGTAFSSVGQVIFGGTGPITVAGGPPNFSSVTIANTTGVTPASNWSVTDNLLIEAGALLNGGAGLTHSISGNWTDNGVFDGTGSTILFNGETELSGIGSTTFNRLLIAGTATALTDFNVLSDFVNNGLFDGTGSTVLFIGNTLSTISGTTTPTPFDSLTIAKTSATTALAVSLSELTELSVDGGTLDAGAFAITQNAAGGSLSVNPGALLRIGGTSTLPAFDLYLFDPASTVEYYGTGTQTISAANYGNLASSSTGARILASVGTIGIAGAFSPGSNAYTITGSTIDFNGDGAQTIPAFNYNNLVSSLTGARILPSSGTIRIAGAFTPGANTYTITNSAINFNGAAQSIPAFTFFNLGTSGSGTKTLAGDIVVNGALSLSAPLADGGFTATVVGDADNDATHTGTGKILLTSGSQEHSLSGSGSYRNLELNDLNGATLTETNLTVTGTLIFTSGNLSTTTNKVIISTAGSVARTSGHIVGQLQKSVPTGARVTNSFEIGDTGSFTPVTVVLTNVTVAGNLTARTTPATHPDITNSLVSATRGVDRYWTITNSGAVFSRYDALFNFVTNNVDSGASPTNFIVAKRDGGVWTLPAVTNRTSTNILATGMTNFSDFVVGEHVPPAPPSISTQPQSQNVNLGGTATFSVDATTGTGTLTYQWLFNGNPIAGANGSTLVITNVDGGDAGTYSVVIDNGSLTTSSSALLTLNQPPALTAITDRNINEGSLLTVATSASDPEGGPLSYALLVAPSGASISSNGVITWTPTEAQGPSTNTFTVQVTDNGVPTGLTDTKSFSVTVNDVNNAPVLTVPSLQTIAEQSALSVNATATDSDTPPDTLTFALVSGPTGLTVSSAGAIAWTPTEAQGPSTNTVTVRVFDNGSPAMSATNSFQVIVTEVNTAPLLTLPATQTLAEQTALSVNATATDSDQPTNTLTFALVSGPTGLTVSSAGAIVWTPTEAQGPSTNTVTVRVFDNGSPAMSATNSFQVIVTEVNTAPLLTLPATQTIAEQTTTLSVNATATDSDQPTNTLTFALVSGPTGLTVSSAGAIAWTPTEAQGPSTNTVTVRVSDNGSPAMSTTNSFQVIVTEVNTAPLLTLPSTQTVAEQTALGVNATATDSDQPTNTLTFALVSGPTGLTVSSAGAIAWTPTEAQGPSTNTVTVRVFDNGSPAISTTNSFQVIVTEVNTAPLLTLPSTQTVAEQTALGVNATATDSDQPTNTLTFALVSGPTGLTVSSAGAIAWTPTEAQGPSTNTVTVRVFDNGSPAMSTTNSFQVIVTEVNTAPLLTLPATQTVAEQTALSVNASATDSDQPTNTLTFALVSGPTGLTVSSAGAIAWTPTEAQGPSTNTVTVRVFDNGSPAMSATNSFQVIVTEANTAPLLTLPATQTVAEQTALSVNATATDSDQPTNTLTFALVSGPTGLTVSSAGAIAWTPTEAQGPSTNTVTVRVFDNGTPAMSTTNTFQVIVTEVNTAPLLTLPATQTIAEQTALSVTATATDSDQPTNTLTFALVSGPTGLTVSSVGAIAWTPTEAQGPSTNTVTVRVFDNGSPAMSATNSFQVIVTEVNTAPLLTLPATQTVAEQTALSVNATATDSDQPTNTLTFALVSGPTGLTVSSLGAIAWTPTEAQGPSTNTVTVRVFDNGSPAISTTNSFQVIVTEVNTAPLLTLPATQTIAEQTALSVNATATDSDQPTNTLTFALVSGPTGLTVSSAGAIAWTPTEAQGPSTNTVNVRVFDNGSPVMSATNSFQVIVTEANTAPLLTLPATQTIAEQTALSATATATDSDQPTNTLTFALVSGPTGLTVSSAGAIAWTPTEAQGPSTNTVTVRVFDNGSPVISATNSFQVIVTEANTAPLLTLPATQTLAEQTALNVTATATDSDQPTNSLTFALVSGPTGLTVSSTGAIAWTPTEAQGPSTNTVTVRVSDNGTPAMSTTNSFQVIVTEVNTAPLLTLPATQTISEQTLLSLTATATDSDQPTNSLTFALVSGPTGLTVSSAGAIAWTPTEAQGPSTNTVTVRVSDNGTPARSATNSFTVTVNESNSAPVLPVQTNRTINELTALTVTNTATDGDVPTNSLTYQLVSPPAGASINTNGVISWTPGESQGPSTATITTIVTDNGSPARSATNSFTVTVDELNSAPTLAPIADRTNSIGQIVNFTAAATDSDSPTNLLFYFLGAGAPEGATLDAISGVFNWTVAAPAGSTNVFSVVVFDSGAPSMSATQTFRIVATSTAPPTSQGIQIVNGNVEVTFGGIPGQSYSIEATQSLNPLVTWAAVATNLVADTNGLFKFVDTQARTLPMRYFRARAP